MRTSVKPEWEERPFTAADNQQMEAWARRTIAYILSGILVALVLGFIVIALFCDSSEERLTSCHRRCCSLHNPHCGSHYLLRLHPAEPQLGVCHP